MSTRKQFGVAADTRSGTSIASSELMPTREISRDEWVAFFDSFSRQHDGWLSTLEIRGNNVATQTETREQPLVGITAELNAARGDVISILIGGKPGEHVAHTVKAPSRVSLEQTQEGAHEALRIETTSGPTTVLRFRSTILPELLDGEVFHR